MAGGCLRAFARRQLPHEFLLCSHCSARVGRIPDITVEEGYKVAALCLCRTYRAGEVGNWQQVALWVEQPPCFSRRYHSRREESGCSSSALQFRREPAKARASMKQDERAGNAGRVTVVTCACVENSAHRFGI